jgi:hypothetical protein
LAQPVERSVASIGIGQIIPIGKFRLILSERGTEISRTGMF